MFPAPAFGAIGGLAGTLVMTVFEYPFWKKQGMTGVLEWQVNRAVVSTLSNRIVRRIRWAILAHLFHGTLAGSVFVLFLPLLPEIAVSGIGLVLSALIYSAVLWLIFSFFLRGVYENAGLEVTGQGILVALMSHLVYGMVLGSILLL